MEESEAKRAKLSLSNWVLDTMTGYHFDAQAESEEQKTIEGHIENLKAIASDMPSDKCSDWIESLMAGVKALEQEPCDDAISRQAVLKAIDAKAWEFCDYLISKGRNDEQKPVSHFADNLRECISEDLPPVTPAEKVGHWIDHQEDRWIYAKCSECETVHDTRTNYCPHCGAKMGGDAE